jgi:integrase
MASLRASNRTSWMPAGPSRNCTATCVKDFGPRSLKAVRERMIEQGLCRRVINSRVNRIRRMFKWGVENEFLHSSVLHALQAVAALKRYRSAARESEGVKPVADWMVDAVVKVVPAPVQAMIELQALTGMRSGEVTIMRACDLETSGRIWAYRPATHKTEHHDVERVIYLGPRAQEVVKPFLRRDTNAYLFSPAEAEAERRAACHLARVTKLSCGNRPGTNRRNRPKKRAWRPLHDVVVPAGHRLRMSTGVSAARASSQT